MSGVGSGSVVCLSAGTYSWGDYRPPAGVTIAATEGVRATVFGEARIGSPNIKLWNLYLKAQDGENHAVVSVDSTDFVAEALDVDGRNQPGVQGFLVGGDRAHILDTKIHSIRGPGGCAQTGGLTMQHFHGIYWFRSQNGEVARVWIYDIGGYGLHFYSGTGAGTKVSQTVTDDSICGRGNVFDSQTGPVTFDKTIITDAGAWSCRTSGATVTNSRSQSGYQGCPGSGNVTADTVYQNEAARDYRVPNNPDFQFVPGPQ